MLSLRLYLGVKAQTYFVSSSRMFLENRKTRKPCLKFSCRKSRHFFTCVVILQKYIPHYQQLWTFKDGECQITTMEADFLSKGTKSHSFWFPVELNTFQTSEHAHWVWHNSLKPPSFRLFTVPYFSVRPSRSSALR